MRWLVLVLLVSPTARAQEPPPSDTVIADVVEAPRAGRRCRLVLRIVTVEDAAALRSGDTVEASVSCYAHTLHQMRRRGRFRFRLARFESALRAQPIGGRIADRARSGPARGHQRKDQRGASRARARPGAASAAR